MNVKPSTQKTVKKTPSKRLIISLLKTFFCFRVESAIGFGQVSRRNHRRRGAVRGFPEMWELMEDGLRNYDFSVLLPLS